MDDRIKELLLEAMTTESLARNKYTFFADKAKEEGYQEIANIFTKTADNEKEHSMVWFKYLGLLNNTAKNLENSVDGEEFLEKDLYPKLSQKAKEYGDDRLSNLFEMAAEIEKEHAKKYRQLLEDVRNNKVFSKDEKKTWICFKCGYEHVGMTALQTCPFCSNKQEYFAVKTA